MPCYVLKQSVMVSDWKQSVQALWNKQNPPRRG